MMNERRGEAMLEHLKEIQLQKLAENEHKGNWVGVPPQKLFALLCCEVNELKMALDYGFKPEEVIRECADVANFAAMIADVIRR